MSDTGQTYAERYPGDVAGIKKLLPYLATLPTERVAELYHEFSEDWWAAGWLRLAPDSIRDFEAWLTCARG